MYVEKRGNSLLIRFTHDCKEYSFSLPKHNHAVGRAAAKLVMAQIEKDIAYGNFDPTLLRYKPRKLGKNPTAISAVELFQKYTDYRLKDRELSHSSIVRFKGIVSKLSQLLGDKPADRVTESVARDTIARWSETVSNRTIKERLFDLRACWDWAKGKYHIADSNPWSDCLDRAKQRGNRTPSKQKKPFTLPEIRAIISAFANHSQYKFYTDLVVFLAGTGCRPGEAIGLRWQSIGVDYSTTWIGESISRGHRNRKGTKTGKSRTIALTPTVRSMLADRRTRSNPQPNDLVFPSPRAGVAIDDHNFCNRAWATILGICQIEYRSPYHLRHSAISHALHNGVNPIALAEQTGHDKRVLLSTYAHAIGNECLFIDLGGL
jgi:integrase